MEDHLHCSNIIRASCKYFCLIAFLSSWISIVLHSLSMLNEFSSIAIREARAKTLAPQSPQFQDDKDKDKRLTFGALETFLHLTT